MSTAKAHIGTRIDNLISETYARPTGYYPRLCLMSLRHQGFTDPQDAGAVQNSVEATDRLKAWATESLYTGLISLEQGQPTMALRCLIQASNYNGQLGGFWWHNLGDSFSHLKNGIESLLEKGVQS